MNKEKLINKWEIDIANCEQIINHCSVTEKTMEFTKGESSAISECLDELKNLTIPVVSGCYLDGDEIETVLSALSHTIKKTYHRQQFDRLKQLQRKLWKAQTEL